MYYKTKRLLASLSWIFLIPFVSAKTILVKSPGNNNDIQPAIYAALGSAIDGDIIAIPQGTFVFNKNIVISKFISFKGEGIGRTVLYRSESVSDATLSSSNSWDTMLKFSINKSVPSYISVSGITFKSKMPSLVPGDSGSVASDIGIKFINCLDFIVTNCRFEYFGNGAVAVSHTDTLARGLISKNEFYHNAKGFNGLGLGYAIVVYGENKKWITNPGFGSKNFIFIEDNTFDMHRHAIAAGGCGLYVARYNTISNNIVTENVSNHAIDTHAARGGALGNTNYYSTRAIEVYNNTIVNTTFDDKTPITAGQSVKRLMERAIAIRGGEAVVYNNIIKGYRFGGAIFTDEIPFGTSYPIPYSPGYLSGLALGSSHTGTTTSRSNGDLFYWGNTFTAYIDPQNRSSQDFYNYQPQYYQENRDFHLTAKPGYRPCPYPFPLSVNIPIAIDETIENTGANIYPNPTKGVVVIEIKEVQSVEITDAHGKVISVIENPDNKDRVSIDLSTKPKGVYSAKIKTINESIIRKIVLE